MRQGMSCTGWLQRGRVLALGGLTLVLVTGSALCAGRSSAQTAQRATIFVVDTSTSMYGQRLATAKDALLRAASAVPATAQVGIRSFGGPCTDGGTVRLPVGPFSEPEYKAAVNSLSIGLSGTPTPAALRAAAANLPPTGDRTLILVSDGDSDCGDPCPTARALAEQLGAGFRIDTVGFQAPDSAEAKLSCIARATGGAYISATDSAGLARALAQTTAGTAPPAAARLTALRLTPSRFRAALRGPSISNATRSRVGARVRYTISARVNVRFSVERVTIGRRVAGRCRMLVRTNIRAPRCTRLIAVRGSFTHAGKQGVNGLRFTGRLGGRKLRPGLYHLVAATTDAAGRAARPARVRFRLLAR